MTDTQNVTARGSAFFVAHLAWLDTRQTLQKTFDVANGDVTDETADRVFKARRDAAWQMVRAPVRGLEDIRLLAVAVQEIFTEADEVGRPTDDVHRALLDRLLREVARYQGSDASLDLEPDVNNLTCMAKVAFLAAHEGGDDATIFAARTLHEMADAFKEKFYSQWKAAGGDAS